jgi:hypothetical protein
MLQNKNNWAKSTLLDKGHTGWIKCLSEGMWAYVVISIGLLDWTPRFEWYMARIVVGNMHSQTQVMMRLDYVLKILDFHLDWII